MIPFNFQYYKPDSIEEAVIIFQELYKEKKESIYYSGGTEIITAARKNYIRPKAVIDIKDIPECNNINYKNNKIIIGSALTLTDIVNDNIYFSLSKTAKEVGDLTVRNKITLGGNICGNIPYKEVVLPLFLSDANVTVAGKRGLRNININDNFTDKLNLEDGEFIVNVIVDRDYAKLPSITKKVRKSGNINYPVVTIAALKKDDYIRVAFTGTTNFPFRSIEVEKQLNNKKFSKKQRAINAVDSMPYKITSDYQGSADYKKFVIINILMDVIDELDEVR